MKNSSYNLRMLPISTNTNNIFQASKFGIGHEAII